MHNAASRRPERTAPVRDVQRTLQSLIARKAGSYRSVFGFGSVERIGAIKQGLPAQVLVAVAQDMQVSRDQLYDWLGIARTTANRKVRAGELLSQDESERTLGIASLVGQVQTIVGESGDAEGFDAGSWTAAWLQEPNAALGGRPPGEFMDTADGRALVSSLIAQMQSGAYA